jgi:hypothetical protein
MTNMSVQNYRIIVMDRDNVVLDEHAAEEQARHILAPWNPGYFGPSPDDNGWLLELDFGDTYLDRRGYNEFYNADADPRWSVLLDGNPFEDPEDDSDDPDHELDLARDREMGI